MKITHYCNAVVDPSSCCNLGAHQRMPMDEGFDDPRCTCPPMYKIRFHEENNLPISANTCGTCWANARSCGCPEPRVVINPIEGVSYSYRIAVDPLSPGMKFKYVPFDKSVI